LTDQIKAANLEKALSNEINELNTETQNAVKAKQFEIQAKILFGGVVRVKIFLFNELMGLRKSNTKISNVKKI